MGADKQFTSWEQELHKTMIQSLVTTFGLDFLLLEDKKGGHVDTIHNVRQDVWATEKAEEAYQARGDYHSDQYHQHKDYIKKGRSDKHLHQKGLLEDSYRNQNIMMHEDRQLDHTISAVEIHNDAGRVLANIDGVELANSDTNLNSTHANINNLKRAHTTEKFLNEILPKKITGLEQSIKSDRAKLKDFPVDTPQQKNEQQKLKDKVRKKQLQLHALKGIDKKKMLAADQKARHEYNEQIDQTYYASTKFFKDTALTSINTGLRMGTREMLGLVLAETWFELKEQIPLIHKRCQRNFILSVFLEDIVTTVQHIFNRIKKRFNDFLVKFKEGAIGGLVSNLTTTIINIFSTTSKMLGKIIRELWNILVKVIKLLFFNPKNLSLGNLAKEAFKLVSLSISLTMGVVVNQSLAPLLTFPFGSELSVFISTFVTGILTVGMNYFLENNSTMQKVWTFLNSFKSKYDHYVEHFQAINAELDQYLLELAKIEFNLNEKELQDFSDNLAIINTEYDKNIFLAKEVERRGLELPFEMDNAESTRQWLLKL